MKLKLFSTVAKAIGKTKVFSSVGKGAVKLAENLKIVSPETTQKFIEERGENIRAKRLGQSIVYGIGVLAITILLIAGKIDGETFERLFIYLTGEQ